MGDGARDMVVLERVQARLEEEFRSIIRERDAFVEQLEARRQRLRELEEEMAAVARALDDARGRR